ncbi:hypothetical protein GGS24DRAFT_476517 [Hypoxylon argillaceum]|nr:hypothetical protein GGS24DRAFT_476517 [Hypoxylon argillaceum]
MRQVSPSIEALERISTPENPDSTLDMGAKYEGHNAQQDIESRWESVSDALTPIFAKFGQDIDNLVEIASQALKIKVGYLVRGRIGTWTTNIESDKLWIQSGYETSHPSQSTLIAASLAALSNENDIPCVSYFCSLQTHNAYETVPSRRCMLLDMVKSLTAQLLLIYKSTQPKADISLESFKQLINPELDLKTALTLLRETRSILPHLTHFLIEGVQELENRSDIQQTRDLQEVLQEVIDLDQMPALVPTGSVDYQRGASDSTELAHQTFSRQVKVCFASDGYVDALALLVEAGQLEMISNENEGEGD